MTTANRREHTATAVGHAVRSGAPAVARLSLSALGGWLIAGWLGALFGALGALVAMLSGELAGAYVVAGVVLTGAATLFEARYGGAFASARFVRERPLAGDVGRFTGVLLLAWLIAARPRWRSTEPTGAPTGGSGHRPPALRDRLVPGRRRGAKPRAHLVFGSA